MISRVGERLDDGKAGPGLRLRRRLSSLGANVRRVGWVSLYTDVSSEMVYPLLPAFIAGLATAGRAAFWLGLVEGIAETTASLLKLVSGRLSDSLGRRKALIVAGYGLSTACRPLTAIAGAAWHVVLARFADRVGKGVRTAPRDALVSDSVAPTHRGLAFSFHRSMDHAGAILGPLAAAAVMGLLLGRGVWTGWPPPEGSMPALRTVFALSLIPGIAAMAVLAIGVREIAPIRRSAPPAGGAPRGMPATFLAYVGIVTLFALGNSSDLFLLLYGQTRFGIGMAEGLFLWVALHASKIVFGIPGGLLADRFGRGRTILAGWAAYAAVYLGMSLASGAWGFRVLFVAYGFYYGMTEGAEKAMVADFVPSERRGAAFGLFHASTGLALLPASVVFGSIWTRWGPRAAFGTGAALAGVAAVLLTLLLARLRSTRRT